jgi:hypothetical protein
LKFSAAKVVTSTYKASIIPIKKTNLHLFLIHS